MVSRKLERLISPGKWIHNLSVLSLSILSAGIFFFVLSESVAYLIFRDKLKTILPMCLFALNRS